MSVIEDRESNSEACLNQSPSAKNFDLTRQVAALERWNFLNREFTIGWYIEVAFSMAADTGCTVIPGSSLDYKGSI